MKNQNGFTLIEVLVTVFVIAVGLLSAAGLQIISKKANFDALQRTQASAMAQSIVSKMRVNSGTLGSYVTADVVTGLTTAPSPACLGATTCSAEQLAQYDLWQWAQSLRGAEETDPDNQFNGGLSQPSGCIQAGANGLYTIVVAWRGIAPLRNPIDTDDETDPSNNACGVNKTVYAAESDEGDVTYRRVLVLETYIAQNAS